MQKNEQIELAYNFVQFTDKNVFLTGKAGTGKTTFLHNLKKESLKRMAVVAPTGVAAINAGGVTIHSFFQLPFGPYISQELAGNGNLNAQASRKFSGEKIRLIQSLDLLVIDEISMVRADLLDGVDEVLRRFKNRHKPFGGVQLLMIGDLHQLSPVIKDDDWKVLRDYYSNLYFFSSRALQKALPVCIELKKIYRQSDTLFISLLNRVRENKVDSEVLRSLNERHIPEFNPNDEDGYITLTTHNKTAAEINEKKLSAIKGALKKFTATIHDEFPEYSYPTVVDLELKVGAQVMFVKNDSSREKQFYNGKIGKVTKIDSDKILVKCPGDTWEIEVLQAQWENIKYELNAETKEVVEKVIGSFVQFPLKLAWAITIHKSQGLTFEKAIIDASGSFAHGQVYVALSRCKSFEGMVLRSPIAFNSVKTDGTVAAYTQKADENAPDERQLEQSKLDFQRSLLFELFDFNTIKTRVFYCNTLIEENDHLLTRSLREELNAIKEAAEKDVYLIADKFIAELNRLAIQEYLPESNSVLQERVIKASGYFISKVEDIYQACGKLSPETDNKTVGKSIGEAINNLKKEIFIKLSGLRLCSGGFNTISYLKNKANAEIDYSSAVSKEGPAIKATTGSTSNFELYAQLKQWRDDLANQKSVPVYLVMPSKVLAELARKLPGTLAELETIKGIGKQKVKQYGKEILDMISAYSEKKNIRQEPIPLLPKKDQKIKVDTKRLSFEMFKSGKSIEEIATERNFARGTIEGHLSHFIGTGELELNTLVSKSKCDKILDFIGDKRTLSLAEIKATFGDEVSFGEIRAVMKYLELISQEA